MFDDTPPKVKQFFITLAISIPGALIVSLIRRPSHSTQGSLINFEDIFCCVILLIPFILIPLLYMLAAKLRGDKPPKETIQKLDLD